MSTWEEGGQQLEGMVKAREGQSVVTVRNPLLFPLACIDVLLTAALCGLNYCLRFDPSLREDCSLVNWEVLQLPCSDLAGISFLHEFQVNHTLTSSVTFTLSESIFFTCAIVVPCCMVILVEVMRSQFPPHKVKKVESTCFTFPLWARRIPRFICTFLLGGSMTGLLVAVIKLLVAFPRPYLLDVCDPEPGNMPVCSSNLTWFPEKLCQGDKIVMHEALRAFPSYHATLALYCGVWTSIYFSTMAKLPGVNSSRLVLVGGIFIMTIVGSTHSLLTHQSSSTDVIAGGLIGTIAAFYVVYGVLNGFKEQKWRMKVVAVSRQVNEPNLLPKLPLGGSPDIIQQLSDKCQVDLMEGSEESSEDESDNDFLLNSLAFSSDSFPIIPRATTISRGTASHGNALVPPAQAVNPIVNDRISIPPPPPPPPSGPPPKYSQPDPWTTSSRPYNVPRQRYSAPAPTPRAPAYDASQTLPHNLIQRKALFAYCTQDSDTLPRARTETSSYF
ncbi:uncharacterized protein [Panulirus ornatus]|uniref:uncharacterized protein n=1 Tax=Panulirus ornatus TaxID=150431 RepID=UPI003A85041E